MTKLPFTERDLLRLPRFGSETVRVFKVFMDRNGYSFKDAEPPIIKVRNHETISINEMRKRMIENFDELSAKIRRGEIRVTDKEVAQ